MIDDASTDNQVKYKNVDIALVIDSLVYMQDYVQRLARGLVNVAAELQIGRESQALAVLPDAADGLNAMIDLIEVALAVLDGSVSGQNADVGLRRDVITALNRQLTAMVTAMERQDYLLLADQCEYELAPFLTEEVRPFLAELTCRIKTGRPA